MLDDPLPDDELEFPEPEELDELELDDLDDPLELEDDPLLLLELDPDVDDLEDPELVDAPLLLLDPELVLPEVDFELLLPDVEAEPLLLFLVDVLVPDDLLLEALFAFTAAPASTF